jgi:hypothetical protein
MADMMTSAKNKAQEVGEKFNQAANNAADSVRNAAGYVVDQVKDAASNASKAGEYLDQQAGNATTAIGGGLKAAGQAIRENAPHEGRFGQASSAVAQSLSDTGSYIEREGLEGIGHDLTGLIKKNPIPALLLGVGLGFLLARAVTPRA